LFADPLCCHPDSLTFVSVSLFHPFENVKKNGEINDLKKLMGKMYPSMEMHGKIKQIVIRKASEGSKA
jgi:hypothetical protein